MCSAWGSTTRSRVGDQLVSYANSASKWNRDLKHGVLSSIFFDFMFFKDARLSYKWACNVMALLSSHAGWGSLGPSKLHHSKVINLCAIAIAVAILLSTIVGSSILLSTIL